MDYKLLMAHTYFSFMKSCPGFFFAKKTWATRFWFAFLFTGLWILSGCNKVADEKKGKEILARYLRQVGPSDSVRSIRNYQSYGVWQEGSRKLDYHSLVVYPDRLKMDLKGTDYLHRTVYEKGLAKGRINDSVFNITKLSALNTFALDCRIMPLFYLDTLASEVYYTGQVQVNHHTLQEVVVKFRNGIEWQVFFDDRTGLIHHYITSEGMYIYHLRYEHVKGILFPTQFRYQLKDFENSTLFLSEVGFNISVQPHDFELK